MVATFSTPEPFRAVNGEHSHTNLHIFLGFRGVLGESLGFEASGSRVVRRIPPNSLGHLSSVNNVMAASEARRPFWLFVSTIMVLVYQVHSLASEDSLRPSQRARAQGLGNLLNPPTIVTQELGFRHGAQLQRKGSDKDSSDDLRQLGQDWSKPLGKVIGLTRITTFRALHLNCLSPLFPPTGTIFVRISG